MSAHRRIRRSPAQIGRGQNHVARTPGSRDRRQPAGKKSMKALLSRNPGGPETLVLEDIPEPLPKPGEVRVAVRACGVNYPDLLIIQDLYQFKPPRPFSPGAELAGVVDAGGEGAANVRVGDRVVVSAGRDG